MRTYLIGAGGHARSIISLLSAQNIAVEGIFDDSFVEVGESILGVPLVGTLDMAPQDAQFYLAIGDTQRRAKIYNQFITNVVKENLIHSSSIIEKSVQLGQSNQLLAFVYCNAAVKIGSNNIINTRATLEHEVSIGDHNHISVGATLCGRVSIGSHCFIGSGSTIIDGVTITDNVIVGAQAVVVSDITEPGTYVGVPAKRLP
jgi:sugar O-acyltransferase (sialic acid O-acetyltransferase NeuD family)